MLWFGLMVLEMEATFGLFINIKNLYIYVKMVDYLSFMLSDYCELVFSHSSSTLQHGKWRKLSTTIESRLVGLNHHLVLCSI
jgi:hypothetical protein